MNTTTLNLTDERVKELESLIINYNNKIVNEITTEIQKSENLGPDFYVERINDSILNIVFNEVDGGTYNDGTPKRVSIDIYIGYDYFSQGYRFELNPFTAGSFNPLENNDLKKYFGAIGKIINDTNLCNFLKNKSKDYTDTTKPWREERSHIFCERERIKKAREQAEKDKIRTDKNNAIKVALGNITPNDYVVAIKGSSLNETPFIYRKKPVEIAFGPADFYTCGKECRNIERTISRYTNNKCVLIEASKIKF